MTTTHPVEVIARILCAEAGADPDQQIGGIIHTPAGFLRVKPRPLWFSKIDAAKQLLLHLGETTAIPTRNAAVLVSFADDDKPAGTVDTVWRTIIRDCGRWMPPAL